MSQRNDQPDTNPAGNAIELTEAEQTALTPADPAAGAAAKDGAADTPPGKDEAPAADDAPAGGTEAGKGDDTPATKKDEPPAAGQPDAAAAAAAAAEPPAVPEAPRAPPAPFVPNFGADDRDYDKELETVRNSLKALKERYASDAGMDDAAYEAEFERLQEEKAALIVDQRSAKSRADMNQQFADQSWAYLQEQFFSDPANAAIRANNILFAAWEAGMQEVVNEASREGRQVSDWELMHSARQKLAAGGFLGAPTPTPAGGANPDPKPDPGPKPERTPPLAGVPTTLATAPSAASPGTPSSADTLAGEGNIEDIETLLAGKSEAERDRILAGTPGAFVSQN